MFFPYQGSLERAGGRAPGVPSLLKPEHLVFFSAICFILWGDVYLNKALHTLKNKVENHGCLNLQISKTFLSEGHAPSQNQIFIFCAPSRPSSISFLRSVALRFALEPFLGEFQVLCSICFVLFGKKVLHRGSAKYSCKVSSLAKKGQLPYVILLFYVFYDM